MLDNIRTQLENEGIEPLLIDIFSDTELNTTIQKHGFLENVEIEIKVSQQEKELFIRRTKIFNAPCPCNKHTSPQCTHSVDANGNAICS